MHSRGEYPREKKRHLLSYLTALDPSHAWAQVASKPDVLQAAKFTPRPSHRPPSSPPQLNQQHAAKQRHLSPSPPSPPCPLAPGRVPVPPPPVRRRVPSQHLPLPPAAAWGCTSASRPAAAAAALSFPRPCRASKQPATARLSPRQLLYPCSPPQPTPAFGKRKRKRKPGAPAAGMLPPRGAELGNGDLRSKGFPFSHVLCCCVLNLPPRPLKESTRRAT